MKLSTIQETLALLDLTPSKSMGQNFLHDQNLARWIVDQLELSSEDHLVEIGPGLGALTELALPLCGGATLLEKDGRLAGFLKERFASDRVEVMHEDAIAFDQRVLFEKRPVKVVGNLPYYVTSPILFKFTASPSPVKRMVITMQRELAERLAAKPSTKAYGSLTLAIQRQWRVKYLKTLPASVFVPQPKVESAVVLLVPREPDEVPDCDGATFERLVRAGFSQRRKQLRKMIAAEVGDWAATALFLGVPETARAEELSLLQWIALANRVAPIAEGGAQNVHDEIFDTVDASDNVVGRATRHETHTNHLYHRAVHIFVFNAAGDLFLQKRSRWKDAHPSCWDSSAAGHVDTGRGYEETAARELKEEIGISAPVEFVGSLPPSAATGQEFVHLFRAKHEGPFKLAPAEIECGAFFPLGVIRRWIAARPEDFASGFVECLRLFTACQGGGRAAVLAN